MDILLRLKQAMKALSLSQKDLAEIAEIPASTVSQMFKHDREPSIKILQTLTLQYKVSPAWILNGTGEMLLKEEQLQTNLGQTGEYLQNNTASKEDCTQCQEQLHALQKENIGLKAQVELLKELLGKR